ncbi:MAG: sigma-70 family RNA polymerase sigma factor [Planctomycetota bacterium]
MTSNEDVQLIERMVRGDEQALGVIHAKYERAILNFIYRMVGNREMAEELSSDVFFRVWRKASLFDARKGAFTTWLYQVAGNVTRNRLESAWRRSPLAPLHEDDRLPASAPGPDADAIAGEQQEQVRAALLTLRPADRMILVLRHFEERSTSEIAAIVRVPEGTVKSRVHYALQRLKRVLLPELESPARGES